MMLLGIDPGTRFTGYGLILKEPRGLKHIENGLILPGGKKPIAERLAEIYAKVTSLIREFQPAEVAIEDVFVAKNARSSLKLGLARGVVMLAAAQAGLEVFEYPPATVKNTVAGFGQAGKDQVQKMVRLQLKLNETPEENAADALAVALCHAQLRGSPLRGAPPQHGRGPAI